VLLPASVSGGPAPRYDRRRRGPGVAPRARAERSGRSRPLWSQLRRDDLRGSGLYTQIVALHFLLWALGLVARALDTGRGRAVAAFFLNATALSHIVFGYVAFVSAALLALVGPAGG